MSVRDHVLKKIAAPAVARCLTGSPRDLRFLLALEKIPYPSPVLRAFLRRLRREMEEGGGMAGLLLRLGKIANTASKRRLITNLIINWAVRGARNRIALRQQGYWVPFFLAISPTMRCNLSCTGCYAGLYAKDGELSEQELDLLFSESKQMGDYFVVLSGGEPYLLKDSLLRLFARHSDMFFLTFTNGTHLDEPTVKALAKLGNVAPAISVEGYREQTDERRGKGVHDRVVAAMRLLNQYGVIFGISVTYTSQNVDLVTDAAFLDYYMQLGVMFAWYFMFMPVGKSPVLALVPTPEQRISCGKKVAELRSRYPIFLADFWNDGPAVGGCLGGARRYLHILNSGRVEPCVFAHFGADNIRQKSVLEAANSPFFKAIRREFPYNEKGNLKRPCMIVDNPTVLRRLVNEYLVPQGHRHSEDILNDPAMVEWLDAYAESMRKLTDPEWDAITNDPASRWFREKPEYQRLFAFQRTDVPMDTDPNDTSERSQAVVH
ncbi:MAG: radical SAM protein [Acidobacteriia bacterium]|nr:radical SAM protein [Terriglobia bacterium]